MNAASQLTSGVAARTIIEHQWSDPDKQEMAILAARTIFTQWQKNIRMPRPPIVSFLKKT